MKSVLTEKPLIYLITGGQITVENFTGKSPEVLKIIEKAVMAKVSLIQIREKLLPARFVFRLVSEAVKITRNTPTRLLVNDRADIALAAGADGVHLTAKSLSAALIRQNFPADFTIGVSTHTIEDAQNAKIQNADFAAFSPVFATPSKERYGAPQGIGKLRAVCEKLKSFPIIALGGINKNNFAAALNAGAQGVAAIRLFSDADNLSVIAEKIREFKKENE